MNVKHLTTAELADRWRCHPGWLANMRSEGTGPSYLKLGRNVVYTLSAVEAYEANATQVAA